MKVLVQNLQKRAGLATKLFEEHDPDVMLAQEINLRSETFHFQATNVSRIGYGTAIGSKRLQVTNVKCVQSPHAEIGGFVRKKTTVASAGGVRLVSFHGYNGQPFKDEHKLVAHVDAVLAELEEEGPSLFAGDFNTWSREHVSAVTERMERAGFRLAFSWPYDGRDVPLDHAFVRGLRVTKYEHYACASDHRGAVIEFDVSK